MRVYAVMADSGGCGFYRILLPYTILQRRGHAVHISGMFEYVPLTVEPRPMVDVIVVQRPGNPAMRVAMESARTHGIPLVVEIDDLLWNIPSWNPAFNAWRTPKAFADKKRMNNLWVLKEFIRECDALTVSTEPLAQEVRARFPDKPVYVLPNCLATDDWPLIDRAARWRAEHKVWLGWGGSATHQSDLTELTGVPGQVARSHDWVHLYGFGWEPGIQKYLATGFPPERVTIEKWFDVFDLPTPYSRIDIGLAPLYHHSFNDSKSSLKAKEYGASATPTVATDSITYRDFVRHGENGFLCTSVRDWVRVLEVLTTDHVKRLEMAMQARKDALACDIDHHVHKWEEALGEIIARKARAVGKPLTIERRHEVRPEEGIPKWA